MKVAGRVANACATFVIKIKLSHAAIMGGQTRGSRMHKVKKKSKRHGKKKKGNLI
jgi:hypothetical protein